MVTFFSVTLPVFFAEKEYVITSPTLVGFWIAEASAVLVNSMPGSGVNGVSVVPGGGVTGGPDGGVPVVVALLAT
ncbi:hypothetical protein PJL18_02479 [Paenarthrobacter nicotinovorans]|nr:hypothetical protein [Paenarthrobacter nicotinovorans]